MLKRYNLIVKTTRVSLLIAFSLCIMLTLYFQIFAHGKSAIVNASITAANLMQSGITASNTVFSGVGKHSYKLSADKISKSSDGLYNMDKVSGKYSIGSNKDLTITANKCFLDDDAEMILLNSDVKVDFENYTLSTHKLDVDLKDKSAVSEMFVHVVGESGGISADSFQASSEFGQVTFNGNVKARFNTGTQ